MELKNLGGIRLDTRRKGLSILTSKRKSDNAVSAIPAQKYPPDSSWAFIPIYSFGLKEVLKPN